MEINEVYEYLGHDSYSTLRVNLGILMACYTIGLCGIPPAKNLLVIKNSLVKPIPIQVRL